MSQEADQEYLLARAKQERAQAAKASDEIVRAIHLRLAHEYSTRAHGASVSAETDKEVIGLISGDGRSS